MNRRESQESSHSSLEITLKNRVSVLASLSLYKVLKSFKKVLSSQYLVTGLPCRPVSDYRICTIW